MSSFDPILLQRLVDGELELDQIQKILQQADASPELWRTLATSMIEDQLWQRSMRQHMSTLAKESSELQDVDNDARPPSSVPPASKNRPDSKSAGAWLNQKMMLAALLLIAVGLGFGFGQFFDRSAPEIPGSVASDAFNSFSGQARLDDQFAANSSPQLDRVTEYRPVYHLEVPEGSQLLSQSGVGPEDSVPLFPVANADQFRRYQKMQQQHRQTSPELFQKFRDAGYHVEQNIEFVSGDLDNDRSFVVPVRKVRLVPSQ